MFQLFLWQCGRSSGQQWQMQGKRERTQTLTRLSLRGVRRPSKWIRREAGRCNHCLIVVTFESVKYRIWYAKNAWFGVLDTKSSNFRRCQCLKYTRQNLDNEKRVVRELNMRDHRNYKSKREQQMQAVGQYPGLCNMTIFTTNYCKKYKLTFWHFKILNQNI